MLSELSLLSNMMLSTHSLRLIQILLLHWSQLEKILLMDKQNHKAQDLMQPK